MSINRGMDKEDVAYIHAMEYYSVIKNNKVMPFAAIWIVLEIIVLSELSDTEWEISYDITYTWNLKYGINELIYKTETNSQT